MSYYVLKYSTDKSQIGSTYPQIQKMRPGYKFEAPDSVHALSRFSQELPSFVPNLDYFVAASKSKLTDILSAAVISGGFLMSDKAKKIFKQHSLPQHKFFSATVQYKGELHDYFWMHIVSDLTDNIDYKKSTFFVYQNFAHNIGYVEIESKDDLVQKKEALKVNNPSKTITIWAEKLSFKSDFKNELDLFEIGMFDANCYISESLYQHLDQAQISGLTFSKSSVLE